MILQRLHAAWLRWRLGITPQDRILADYEVLIRLARRCAYDFRHAADYVELPPYLKDLDYRGRADWWAALFAKGNPGKDYRIKITMDLDEVERYARELYALCQEHKVPIPDSLQRKLGDVFLPF